MSELTEILQRISTWVQQYQPEKDGKKIPLLAPGLTHEEIESKVKDLPFRLSVELYELYQWHNGGYSCFLAAEEQEFVKKSSEKIKAFSAREIVHFISLDEALSYAISRESKAGKHIFPIFAWQNNSECTLLDSEQRETSPIVDSSTPSEKFISFPSITNMMLYYTRLLESKYLWIY
ncbi:hypothetical protein [Tolypothrix sp. VBCCA 56010]|uniref:hypothetical protein n=1 Tax=Tolypothrix sp. VBCCA 56010 TaxID=3137731 RepID=UPI003D7D6332